MKSISKGLHTFLLQLIRHGLHRDAEGLKIKQNLAGLRYVLLETAGTHDAVIQKRRYGLRWCRVDRVWADQLLNVDHIAICRILGACRGP